MKLLIVNEEGIKGGGAEKRIELLIGTLLKKKIFSEIHLLSKKSECLPKIFCHSTTENQVYSSIKSIIMLHQIDIVQVHNSFRFVAHAIRGAKELGKPVVFFAHDYWGFCGRRILLNNKKKICSGFGLLKCLGCIRLQSIFSMVRLKQQLNKCDIAIAPSKFVQQIYEKNGVLQSKWRIIPPWIDLRLFRPNKRLVRNKKVVLFVGPLTHAKGADLLARSLKYVIQKIPDLKLKFIGYDQETGSRDRKRIENILKRDWALQNCEFCGPKNEKELVIEYQKAGVYICTPVWPEIFGQTWAQAKACGCPVIATRVGSIPYLEQNLIFLEKFDYTELASLIISSLENPKMSKSGYTTKLSLQNALKDLRKVYLSISQKIQEL